MYCDCLKEIAEAITVELILSMLFLHCAQKTQQSTKLSLEHSHLDVRGRQSFPFSKSEYFTFKELPPSSLPLYRWTTVSCKVFILSVGADRFCKFTKKFTFYFSVSRISVTDLQEQFLTLVCVDSQYSFQLLYNIIEPQQLV